MLALLDALLQSGADRQAVSDAVTRAVCEEAERQGIDLFDLERKASKLCEYGGPVIYYP